MIKLSLTIVVLVLSTWSIVAQIAHHVVLNFDSGDAELSPASIAKIDSVMAVMTNYPQAYKIYIRGYADAVGTSKFNQYLSIQRAQAVVPYLLEKKIAPTQITTEGLGSNGAIGDNQTAIGRAQNRRVEVDWVLNLPNVQPIENCSPKTQHFLINAQKDTILEDKLGTTMIIGANAFETIEGEEVEGTVEIIYVEYRDPIDFIVEGIPMDYWIGGEQYYFNSAGMFSLRAYQNGLPLKLKLEQPIEIYFRLNKRLPYLNFYQLEDTMQQWTELSAITGADGKSGRAFDAIQTPCMESECSAFEYLCKHGVVILNRVPSFVESLEMMDLLRIQRKKIWLTMDSLNNSIAHCKAALATVNAECLKNELNFRIKVLKKNRKKLQFKLNCTNCPKEGFEMYKNTAWKYRSENELNTSLLTQIYKGGILQKEGRQNRFELLLKTNQTTLTWQGLKAQKIKGGRKKLNVLYQNYQTAAVQQQEKFQALKQQQQVLLDKLEVLQKLRTEQQLTLEQLNDEQARWYDIDCMIESTYLYDRFFPKKKRLKNNDLKEWAAFFDRERAFMKDYLVLLDSIKETASFKTRCKMEAMELPSNLKNQGKLRSLFERFSINQLGVYNADAVFRMKTPLVTVEASYVDQEGNDLAMVNLFLIDHTFNGILKFNGAYKMGPKLFRYCSTSQNTLIGIDPKGIPYIFSSDDFAQIKQTKGKLKYCFQMRRIEAKDVESFDIQ